MNLQKLIYTQNTFKSVFIDRAPLKAFSTHIRVQKRLYRSTTFKLLINYTSRNLQLSKAFLLPENR